MRGQIIASSQGIRWFSAGEAATTEIERARRIRMSTVVDILPRPRKRRWRFCRPTAWTSMAPFNAWSVPGRLTSEGSAACDGCSNTSLFNPSPRQIPEPTW